MMQICRQLLYTHHTEIRVGMLGRNDRLCCCRAKNKNGGSLGSHRMLITTLEITRGGFELWSQHKQIKDACPKPLSGSVWL